MQYDQYSHGRTKIFHVLFKVNHILFKKQQTSLFELNSHTKYKVVLTSLILRFNKSFCLETTFDGIQKTKT